MRYELEVALYYARLPKTRRFAAVLVPLAVIAASLSPNYAPLIAQLEHAYLTSEGRAPEQIAQQQAAERTAQAKRDADQRTQAEASARAAAQAAEQERARQTALAQQQIEQQQQREAQQLQAAEQAANEAHQAQLADLFHTRFLAYQTAWKAMHYKHPSDEITTFASGLETLVKDPDFYTRASIGIEETASARDCSNPRDARPFASERNKTYANMIGCASYYARKANSGSLTGMDWLRYIIPMAGYSRATDGMSDLLLDEVLEYAWTWLTDEELTNPALLEPVALPPIARGNVFNPDIVPYTNWDFAILFLQNSTPEEQLRLADESYPRIAALVNAYNGLAEVCRALQRSPCVPH